MKIVMIGHFDCAGQMLSWKRVLGSDMKYFVEKMTANMYDDQSSSPAEFVQAAEEADAIFHHVGIRNGAKSDHIIEDDVFLGTRLSLYGDKTFAFINGSTNVRDNRELYRKMYYTRYRGVTATTPDLCEMFQADYLPQVTILRDLVVKKQPLPPVVAFQFPTDRRIKNTDEWEALTSFMEAAHGSKFFGRVRTGLTNPQCIDFKASKCHIVFDHLGGYFGVNTLEGAWAECTVLASLSNRYFSVIQEFANTNTLPFINVSNVVELKNTLAFLLANPDLIIAEGKRARRWMETFWTAERFRDRILQIVGGR